MGHAAVGEAEQQAGERDRPAAGARGVLVILLLINLFNYIDRQVLSAVERDISLELLPGDPRALEKMGWLANAFLLSYMVLSPFFGRLAGRMSRWTLIGFGVALWSLASGATGLASTYVVLLVTRCFVGVGEAAYGPIAPTLIADVYPVKVRGQVLAWFYAAIPVGSALGYVLGGAMSSHVGWRWAFYVVVPPGLVLALWAVMKKEVRRPAAGGSPKSPAKPRSLVADLKQLLKIPSYVYDCVGMTFMTFAIGGIAFFMPRYMVEAGAGEAGKVGFWFGVISASAGLLATLAGGWLGDRLKQKLPGSYFLVSAFGLGIGFPLFFAVLYAPLPWKWPLLFCAVFALFFNTGPSNTILANVTPPALRPTAFAVNIFVIHALGDAISPVAIGFVADRTNLQTGFLVASFTFLLGAVFWFLGAPHLQRDTANAEGLTTPATAAG